MERDVSSKILRGVVEEASQRYDREIPGWVDFKLLGADLIRWIYLETMSRMEQRLPLCQASPSSHDMGELTVPSQSPSAPAAEHDKDRQGFELLPIWLSEPQ